MLDEMVLLLERICSTPSESILRKMKVFESLLKGVKIVGESVCLSVLEHSTDLVLSAVIAVADQHSLSPCTLS